MERTSVTLFFATCPAMQLASVCTPMRSPLLIKLLLLTATVMGQWQVIVNSDRSLSHTMTEGSSKFDNMTQWTGHHCCVYSGPTQKSCVRRQVTQIMLLQCLLHCIRKLERLTHKQEDVKKALFVEKKTVNTNWLKSMFERLLTDSHSLSFFWALSKSKFTYRHSTNSVIGSL